MCDRGDAPGYEYGAPTFAQGVMLPTRATLALMLALAVPAAGAEPPKCVADGVDVFPAPGAIVPTNVQFLLEGAGTDQQPISELVGSGKLALVTDGDTVPLKVERAFVSTFRRLAVRLRPTRELKSDHEYSLDLGEVLSRVVLLNDVLGGNALRWTTGPGPDKAPPKVTEKPAISEGFYDKQKDGSLTRWLKFRASVEDSSPVYVLVTMQRSRGSSVKQQYPVPLQGDSFRVGHDPCSGSVVFDDGRAYRLTFEVYDSAGNRSNKPGTLEVSAPRPPLAPPDTK